MNEVILNTKNFSEEINNTDKLVLIDFFATWCSLFYTQAGEVE